MVRRAILPVVMNAMYERMWALVTCAGVATLWRDIHSTKMRTSRS